jgi:hypothetical protein
MQNAPDINMAIIIPKAQLEINRVTPHLLI